MLVEKKFLLSPETREVQKSSLCVCVCVCVCVCIIYMTNWKNDLKTETTPLA